MRVDIDKDNVIISDISHFSVEQTLECGQCFHFDKLGENRYLLVSGNRYLVIEENNGAIILRNTTIEDYNYKWKEYFDIERDYNSIIQGILKVDEGIKEAIEDKKGVRLLKQEPFETLISFIISQNKQIPHIKKIVKVISEKYGEAIGEHENEKIYAFPTIERLREVTEEELRECKVGFRAPYIYDACKKVYEGSVNLESLRTVRIDEARAILMSIKGVGEKVADCVLLFGLSRMEVFPTDVWIKRVVEDRYFGREAKKEEIQEFARNKFGDLAGFAQQYLFYYGREKKVGKKLK